MFLTILRVLFVACLLQISYSISEENECLVGSSSCSLNGEMSTSVDFEVFGRVQGVFFRKYTYDKAKQLGLKGYVMNTYSGTVVGTIEGQNDKISEMKRWLQYTGSPSSRIDRCEFKNEKAISSSKFSDFRVKH